MDVRITPKSTQHTGMSLSTEGSVAAWEVTFHLDGDESLHAAISIRLAGPPTHHEARQKAFKILQVFLNDSCEAAKKYQFSIRTLPTGVQICAWLIGFTRKLLMATKRSGRTKRHPWTKQDVRELKSYSRSRVR